MTNIKLPNGDYASVLSDLKEKRQELEEAIMEVDEAIDAIETILNSDILGFRPANTAGQTDMFKKENNFADMSVYEGAVAILSDKKQALTTDEILEALIKGGKTFTGNARMGVATTLYKSVKTKKNCRIVVAGKGKWQLIA